MSHLTILSFLLPLILLIRQSAANILAAFYLLNDYHIFYFLYIFFILANRVLAAVFFLMTAEAPIL